MDSEREQELEPELKLKSLIHRVIYLKASTVPALGFISVVRQIMSLIDSMDLDSQPKPESQLITLVKKVIYLVSSMTDSDPDYEFKSVLTQMISLIRSIDSDPDAKQQEPVPQLLLLSTQTFYYLPSFKSGSELRSCISEFLSLVITAKEPISTDLDLEPESKLISLISQLCECEGSGIKSLMLQIISLVMSMDLDSRPKPESKLFSLVSQTVSLLNSMDLDSQPQPLQEFISLISQESTSPLELELTLLAVDILDLEPVPELVSLIHQITLLAISMDPKWQKLISLSPRVYVTLKEGKIQGTKKFQASNNRRSDCFPLFWDKINLTGESSAYYDDFDATHFRCTGCNGENHETYEKALVEIKHPLHPKHSLQLVILDEDDDDDDDFGTKKKCYCCGEDLKKIFYFCSACDCAMNIACVEKPSVLSIDLPKRHEHQLAHFPRQASLTCDLCALPDSSCPFYICLLCDFVVHQSCISLPYVIKISRHPHRISFTPSFDQGSWSCGVCRREINNNYGGYSCIKAGCSYVAHSKCATQSNLWDGTELEGVPEEIEEEEEEPFVRITDGIIQHFSHEHHHLKLDENVVRDYDENKQCHACVTPIYYGNYYSCMQCEFILHETCANLSRKMYHPVHPHQLTLKTGHEHLIIMGSHFIVNESMCSACPRLCISGFFYKCGQEGCCFKLHVQCALLHEPLDHGSHIHPLFLTSKPGEDRECSVCKRTPNPFFETFNCIECDFALCFPCATLPQTVSYKHDKHMLTLSYGKEIDLMSYWCEACEGCLYQRNMFYICEYCCVTLHINCLIGKELYMKPGASWLYNSRKVEVLPNNQHMSRPFCSNCEKRCPYNVVFQRRGVIFCSTSCLSSYCWKHY